MKSLVIMLALVFVLSVSADEFLNQLQSILNQQRGSWTAAETDVSKMNAFEQESLCGLLPNIPDVESVMEVSREELSRAYMLKDTPIKNQASCGSCYSFGASACYEGWKLNTASQSFDLSEQYFMMKAKEIGPYGGCSGWYLDTSMNLLKNYGVPAESCCPYKGYEAACPSTCTGNYKISSWSSTTDLNTIKAALASGKPVYAGFAVYTDFSYYAGGVYRFTSGSLRGYHAVCIFGYDDTKQCFIVKNSWGTGWGCDTQGNGQASNRGYFLIGYDQMNNSVQFGTCFGGSFYINN